MSDGAGSLENRPKTGRESGRQASDGPWFDLPDAAYVQRAQALSNQPDVTAAADEFRQNGFLIRDFGFSESDLAAAAAYTKSLGSGRMQDAWMVNQAVRNLAIHPAVLEFLANLYQAEPFPFQTLNFPRGSQQDTHSDTFHFNSLPVGFMCGVWVALEDIHPDSGPLRYYPGSHKQPVFSTADLNGRDTNVGYNSLIAEKVHEFRGGLGERAVIRRGQAFVWHANLFHGGTEVADPTKTRLSQVSHYYFKGCAYFTPRESDEAAGKVFWREPYDFLSGKFVRNPEKDQQPGLKYRITERLRIWGKRPIKG